MAKFKKRPPITLAVQELRIKSLYPHLIDDIKLERNQLICFMRLQPSPESIVYRVKIVYKLEKLPKVWLMDPSEIEAFEGKKPHHIYEFDKDGHARLCVFNPRLNEWNSHMLLAESFIPWVITWLSAYEFWQITGFWLYPESTDAKEKKRETD